MHVQIVNFNLRDMTGAGFRSMAKELEKRTADGTSDAVN